MITGSLRARGIYEHAGYGIGGRSDLAVAAAPSVPMLITLERGTRMTSLSSSILQRSFRLADAADIVLVSLFLYTFFLWFRSTASRQILIGMGVLAVVYVLARTFDLYMTAAMFQAVLAFAAIAAIVVFQEDLRRSFARLAALGKFPRARTFTVDANLDILVEIAFDLAKKRIGALLRGSRCRSFRPARAREHVAVDARISKALLDSIFDPHSMGHDGAVIIDRDRISQFAAHLPLSENSQGDRHPRHAPQRGVGPF